MLTLLAVLIGAGDIDREMRPKRPAPLVVPIPTGSAIRWEYSLSTGWRSMSRARPVWRTGKRIDDSGRWEEALLGQPGCRVHEIVAEDECQRTVATAGRNPAGSGGVGEGFDWSVFVGNSWTAGLDVEFTSNGPRIVLALAYYPFEGVCHRYGWSVLSGQLLHRNDWHFTADDLQSIYYMPRLAVLFTVWNFWRSLGLDRAE